MQNAGNFIVHDFAFDAASESAISSSWTFAPRPIGPGYKRSFATWLDKSRNEKLLQNLPPETTTLKQKLNVVSPGQWSAEKPFVYTLVISLRNARDNTVIQAESCRVGFRSVEISDGVLRVNQKPIMVRGVNYHEHDPITGHSVSSQLLEADLKLMKRHNFNAIRTSHYPQTAMFYELCTLYGLFVVDEANIETHGMKPYAGRLSDSLDWERAYMRRLIRMVRCHRNHTCIISWSLGNESGYGRTHDKMASLVRKYESDRVVMYEPASYGPRESNSKIGWFGLSSGSEPSFKKVATDVLCPMYPRVEDCIVIANSNPDMPVILCEYAHMMGNSGGNLELYWKWFNNFSRLQGGFIWDWVDQAISTVGILGRPIWAYGGDFGESSHSENFCLNGLNWPDRGLGNALILSKIDSAEVRYSKLLNGASLNGSVRNAEMDTAVMSGRRQPSPSHRGQTDEISSERPQGYKGTEWNYLQLKTVVGFENTLLPSGYKDFENSLLDYMKISRHVYGLQRLVNSSCQESSREINRVGNQSSVAVRANLQTTSFSIPVSNAVHKPQLLEAKQCMKCFDCEVTSLHPTIWDRTNQVESSNISSLNVSNSESMSSVQSGNQENITYLDRSLSRYNLSMTIHFSVLNRLDHINNIEDYLRFDVLLLCDGMVVDRQPMTKRSRHGSTNRRHVFDPDDGMKQYMQEVEMSCRFNVKLASWKAPEMKSSNLDGDNTFYSDTTVPPMLPLSRCCAASLPTAVPNSRERNSVEISKGSLNPKLGWTAYGFPWPEDAFLTADSFEDYPFGYNASSEEGVSSFVARRSYSEVEPNGFYKRSPEMYPVSSAKCGVSTSNAEAEGKESINEISSSGGCIRLPTLWSDVTIASKWSTVVIGRLLPDTPWAESGYPMGFVQCNISGKLIYSLLPKTEDQGNANLFPQMRHSPDLYAPSESENLLKAVSQNGAESSKEKDRMIRGAVDASGDPKQSKDDATEQFESPR